MGRKKKQSKIGQCALCKIDVVELRDSHIIPKLVYTRLKEYPNSRFRNLYQIKDIYQDGEKKPMLCSHCELFFNKFETPYTNKILDPYLRGEEQKDISYDVLNNFINSLSWRIIYDDLYNSESFKETGQRSIFEGMENTLRKHLNEVREGVTVKGDAPCFKNYVFKMNDFKFKLPVKELLSFMTFGYCCQSKYGNYYILVSFLDFVFVTEFKPTVFLTDEKLLKGLYKYVKRSNIKARVKEELLYTAQSTAQQMMLNFDNMDEAFIEQIIKRYGKGNN